MLREKDVELAVKDFMVLLEEKEVKVAITKLPTKDPFMY